MTMRSDPILLETIHLKKYFFKSKFLFGKSEVVKAVDDVNISIPHSKTYGLVGESGCGKTTFGESIIMLQKPTSGKVFFNDVEITAITKKELKKIRQDMQIVFQDPLSSLDPRMKVKDIIAEPIVTHTKIRGEELTNRARELLELVGLRKEHLYSYPHEFSGGQKQRIGIARTIALNPKFIVLDEPSSALDISVQAKILNLLVELQKKFSLTYLFITHDLGVAKYICDRIGVMYLGKIVEIGDTNPLFEKSMHPYTRLLFSAIPIPDPEKETGEVLIKGEPPSAINPPSGCRFHPRCPHAMDICKKEEPQLKEVDKNHYVACHLYDGEKV